MIRINLFDQIACFDAGVPLPIPYKQCGWLLARLACELGPRHDRSKIARDVWPNADSVAAQVNLRKAVHSLSGLLGPETLCRDRRFIWLNPERVTTELEEFRSILQSQNPQISDLAKFEGRRFLSGLSFGWAHVSRSDLQKRVHEYRSRLGDQAARSLEACLADEPEARFSGGQSTEPWDGLDTALNWYCQFAPKELADFLWGMRSIILASGPSKFFPLWQSLRCREDLPRRANGLILLFLGNALLWSCRQREAITLLARSVMIFQEERQSEMLDLALLIQSVAALQALDYNLVQRNIPRIRNSASQTILMGLYQWNQMNLEGAVTTFERLDRILSNADASQKLQNSGNLSLLYQELGRTRDAVRRANEVDDFRRETRDKRLDMFGDQIRGARHRLVGETKQALAVL